MASSSANKASDTAGFVRWATDIAIGFLYEDPTEVAIRGEWGAKHMRSVQETLQQCTSTVYNAIEGEGGDEREEQTYRLLLLLLHEMFTAINEHHKQVPDSNVGMEEFLTVGDETTFVRRGSNPPENVRELYTTIVMNYGLPKHQFLEMAEQVITRQLQQQKHPMPVEYAIRTLAPAIPTLDPTVLQRLPTHQWLEWAKDLHLEHICEEIASGVKSKLGFLGKALPEPRALTSASIRNETVKSAASNTTCLLAGLQNPDTNPMTLFGDGWSGVQYTQESRVPQTEQPNSTSLPRGDETNPTSKAKRGRRNREARKLEWKQERRAAAAGLDPKLLPLLEDFERSLNR